MIVPIILIISIITYHYMSTNIYIYVYISVYKQARKSPNQAFFTMSVQLCIEIYKRLEGQSSRDNVLLRNRYCMEDDGGVRGIREDCGKVCIETRGGKGVSGGGSIAISFKLLCVCFYIRLFNTGKILLL